jgi:hypothetical protein
LGWQWCAPVHGRSVLDGARRHLGMAGRGSWWPSAASLHSHKLRGHYRGYQVAVSARRLRGGEVRRCRAPVYGRKVPGGVLAPQRGYWGVGLATLRAHTLSEYCGKYGETIPARRPSGVGKVQRWRAPVHGTKYWVVCWRLWGVGGGSCCPQVSPPYMLTF